MGCYFQLNTEVVLPLNNPEVEQLLTLITAEIGSMGEVSAYVDKKSDQQVVSIGVSDYMGYSRASSISDHVQALAPHLVEAACVYEECENEDSYEFIGPQDKADALRAEHACRQIVAAASEVHPDHAQAACKAVEEGLLSAAKKYYERDKEAADAEKS